MKTLVLSLFAMTLVLVSCKNETKTESSKLETTRSTTNKETIEVVPIAHATMVLNYEDHTIYTDPTGGAIAFEGQKPPTLILITDIHGDHYNVNTLMELNLKDVLIIAPQAVVDKFPEDFKPKYRVLNNGQSVLVKDITIDAIPMYNLPEDETSRHPKGRGNGYILTLGKQRVYISGDTEDIPEMRNLKNIDKAFVCMNLPYTMSVESAASAVLDFNPKQVYPFHFRGKEGFSDVERFKSLVNEGNSDIEVVQLDWYPVK